MGGHVRAREKKRTMANDVTEAFVGDLRQFHDGLPSERRQVLQQLIVRAQQRVDPSVAVGAGLPDEENWQRFTRWLEQEAPDVQGYFVTSW
jgi:hypothetical protein